MNHDEHTFFASRVRVRVRVRTSSAALVPGGCVERGIEGSRWHHLSCVVFYHWQSSKEGLPTRTSDLESES